MILYCRSVGAPSWLRGFMLTWAGDHLPILCSQSWGLQLLAREPQRCVWDEEHGLTDLVVSLVMVCLQVRVAPGVGSLGRSRAARACSWFVGGPSPSSGGCSFCPSPELPQRGAWAGRKGGPKAPWEPLWLPLQLHGARAGPFWSWVAVADC